MELAPSQEARTLSRVSSALPRHNPQRAWCFGVVFFEQLFASVLSRTIGAHSAFVTAVALSPRLQPLPYAATGSEDCVVRLWYRPLGHVQGDALSAAVQTAASFQTRRTQLRGHNAPITVVHVDTFKIVSAR